MLLISMSGGSPVIGSPNIVFRDTVFNGFNVRQIRVNVRVIDGSTERAFVRWTFVFGSTTKYITQEITEPKQINFLKTIIGNEVRTIIPELQVFDSTVDLNTFITTFISINLGEIRSSPHRPPGPSVLSDIIIGDAYIKGLHIEYVRFMPIVDNKTIKVIVKTSNELYSHDYKVDNDSVDIKTLAQTLLNKYSHASTPFDVATEIEHLTKTKTSTKTSSSEGRAA